MSSQRSDWRGPLRANPSRMEQELAFRLQNAGIHLPDTDRDSCYDSRLLFRNRAKTTDSVCRRPGSSWKDPSSQGRRTTIVIAEERIQDLGVALRQLLGQEEKPAVRPDPRQFEKVVARMRTRQSRTS